MNLAERTDEAATKTNAAESSRQPFDILIEVAPAAGHSVASE
jgi:hypothetical protein